MAHLHRFVSLGDRFNSQVFTFIVPPKILRDYADLSSREFEYGYQRWTLSFVKSAKHIGVFLELKKATEGLNCTIDFVITLINHDHFTRNEELRERKTQFTVDMPRHGNPHFIEIEELIKRNFAMPSGDFMVEVELRHIKTVFEDVIQLPRRPSEVNMHQIDYQNFETRHFHFGDSDWNVALSHLGDDHSSTSQDVVRLTRLTNFDLLCKTKYAVVLGKGKKMTETDIMEVSLDSENEDPGYTLHQSLYNTASHKGRLQLLVEMYSTTYYSRVRLEPLTKNKNRAHCYDREQQAWLMESNVSGPYLKLRLYYTDVKNVPRRYTRFVNWSVAIVPALRTYKPVKGLDGPYTSYYSQQTDAEKGYEMVTNIRTEELNDPDNIYLDENDHTLTVEIHWLMSHLLYQVEYGKTDDVHKVQRHQMSRELLALQAENYSLEKQLHSYQQAIAKKDSKGRYSEDGSLED
ncbi:uncharacterized protein LOC106179232 [Lingula anatina]|uniref:Uncharacterized protein LOC106179232 n=1 Tax=Lingula anatina TaxID=7574 RepID=A0A1S3K6U9_LINAN|nr:uncharacterized protein LOC106179232 [Lingula anatina]|eukprot:XP_013418227.1 uncharacterized protein LOC106179232 [Lingula anatina]